MPGLVNGHHHFGVTPLMQGVPFAPLELWLPQFRAMRRLPPPPRHALCGDRNARKRHDDSAAPP
jgi:hypothetical protein